MLPRITVVTPNFNGGKYLHDALMSVSAQNVKCLHRVQDANSTDSSANIVRNFNKTMNTHVQIIQKSDSGISQALNFAVEEIKTDFFGWLNSDEFYFEGVIEHIIEIFDKTDADVIYGDCAFVDADGRAIRLVPGHIFSSFVLRNYGCFISSCTVFFRTNAIKDNRFDEACRRAMDWDMWLTLSGKLKFHYEPLLLGAFRVHLEQITSSPEVDNLEEFKYLQEKHNLRSNPVYWRKLSLGSFIHAVLKIASGSYARQWQFTRNHKQESMLWWAN